MLLHCYVGTWCWREIAHSGSEPSCFCPRFSASVTCITQCVVYFKPTLQQAESKPWCPTCWIIHLVHLQFPKKNSARSGWKSLSNVRILAKDVFHTIWVGVWDSRHNLIATGQTQSYFHRRSASNPHFMTLALGRITKLRHDLLKMHSLSGGSTASCSAALVLLLNTKPVLQMVVQRTSCDRNRSRTGKYLHSESGQSRPVSPNRSYRMIVVNRRRFQLRYTVPLSYKAVTPAI